MSIEEKDCKKIIKEKNSVAKSKAIADVLEAFAVIPVEVPCNSYEDFYEKITASYLPV